MRDTDPLVADLLAFPEYQGWHLSWVYPGFLCYSRPDVPRAVFFTLSWSLDGPLAIEVQDRDSGPVKYGDRCTRRFVELPLLREDRTAQKIFDLVRPTIDASTGFNGDVP